PSPNNKYEIASRSKLKNLPEALREFEDAPASVVCFVKSASYFLPRSDSSLTDFLDMLLTKVKKIQSSEPDPELVREKIRYLIGYSNWSMDAVCNIFKETRGDNVIKRRLENMVGAELKVLGQESFSSEIVEEIMKWKEGGNRGRR
ncbi:hypothetical protein KA005_46610, partial [bacterium]|nr:hypothetical protein [bacterium]